MKSTTFVCAAVFAALVIGCRENNLTGPDSTARPNSGVAAEPGSAKTIPVNRIPFNTQLREPGPFHNAITAVNGYVDYTVTVLTLDPIPPLPQVTMSVELSVNAELSPFGYRDPVWYAFGSSNDDIVTGKDGGAFVQKSYRVQGRSDGISLTVKFRISEAGVEVANMWLELPRHQSVANGD